MKLAVLNPGGNDPEQHFPDGAGAPDDRVHPPVNYHAYAACTGGSFHREEKTIPQESHAVLVLLRRDLKRSLRAVEELKRAGKTVAVSLKESGLHQVAALLSTAKNSELFQRICAAADGALSSTPELVAAYAGAGAKRAEFIPTPYPIDDTRWDFGVPWDARDGIFIGTREFDVPSRNHAVALLIARSLGCKTTVFNVDGRSGRKLLDALAFPQLEIIDGAKPYSEYLRVIARHRVVFQLDTSCVPGQVAGDALLTRVPCVGGTGAIERLAFPQWCGHGRSFEELATILRDAPPPITPPDAAGFSAGATALARFFASLRP